VGAVWTVGDVILKSRFEYKSTRRVGRFLDLSAGRSLYRRMFGLPSLSKLLVLVAIISAIWFAFRLIGQLDRNRREAARKEKEQVRVNRPRSSQVDDMVKCAVCGTFTARGGKSCGKAGCPF
jgi:hypothetical protein